MWDPVLNEGSMPGFWPPKPSRFWAVALSPLRHYYLHRFFKISTVAIDRWQEASARFGPGDGVLIAPNHSHDVQLVLRLYGNTRRQNRLRIPWSLRSRAGLQFRA